jgi:hypothetical protein
MARMSREFTLVLLGAGLLTAGYFLWPEDKPAEKAEAANADVGNNNNNNNNQNRTYYRSRFTIIPLVYSTGGTRSPAMARPGVTRAGFGRTGGFAIGG